MLKILLCGALGNMGKAVLSLPEERHEVVCGVDTFFEKRRVPVYTRYESVRERVDTIVDFSSPSALPSTLSFAKKRKIGVVVATTGLLGEDIRLLRETADKIPVFYASNLSPAVFLLRKLAKTAQKYMNDASVYIVEKHRLGKVDTPSGTAKTLQEDLSLPSGNTLSLRGGSCPGEHEVVFMGKGETLTLTHRAEDRSIFARGAISAALFLQGKTNGLFGMEDLFE